MIEMSGHAVIGEDLVIQGDVRNGGEVEVRGRVVGTLSAERVIIHPGGQVRGTLTADSADVRGHLEGRIRVKNLIDIGDGGVVQGDVRYGQLVLSPGGDLAADVRNIPPQLTGDFEMLVRRGRSVRIAMADISAFDPDDTAESLVYTVSNAEHGFVAKGQSPGDPVTSFTQADIAAGSVIFVHDGSGGVRASFDVVVGDAAGNSSGSARTVAVEVIAAG